MLNKDFCLFTEHTRFVLVASTQNVCARPSSSSAPVLHLTPPSLPPSARLCAPSASTGAWKTPRRCPTPPTSTTPPSTLSTWPLASSATRSRPPCPHSPVAHVLCCSLNTTQHPLSHRCSSSSRPTTSTSRTTRASISTVWAQVHIAAQQPRTPLTPLPPEGNMLAILSIQNQEIHLYQLRGHGILHKLMTIGGDLLTRLCEYLSCPHNRTLSLQGSSAARTTAISLPEPHRRCDPFTRQNTSPSLITDPHHSLPFQSRHQV